MPNRRDQKAREPTRSAESGGLRIELLPREPYEVAYTLGHAVIGFAFEGQTGLHAFASDRRSSFRATPNSLAFVPAGCDVYSRSAEGGEYLTLVDLAEPLPAPLAERRFNNRPDTAALYSAETLRKSLLAGRALDHLLLLEHHAGILRDRVLRLLGAQCQERAAGWMTPRRLGLIDELIEARLDGALTVRDLANRVGLSAGFFSRAFKAAIGKPPHAYIVDRRISRARSMLRSTRLDLSAVAQLCGFSSHAHMTSAFRARLGVAPAKLRSDGAS
jgi:AraC family transcriptional regulator